MGINKRRGIRATRKLCQYHPQILPQANLKQETKIDGRDHEFFFEKAAGPWNI